MIKNRFSQMSFFDEILLVCLLVGSADKDPVFGDYI